MLFADGFSVIRGELIAPMLRSGDFSRFLAERLKSLLLHRGGNKHRVFDAENMSGCYRKPVEDFRKRVLRFRDLLILRGRP
jgi:hypothetical protein